MVIAYFIALTQTHNNFSKPTLNNNCVQSAAPFSIKTLVRNSDTVVEQSRTNIIVLYENGYNIIYTSLVPYLFKIRTH